MVRGRRNVRLGGSIAMALALALSAGPAIAEKKGGGAKKPAAAVPHIDAKAASEKLKSGDVAQITSALVEATKLGAGATEAAPAIEELLRRGAPSEIAKAAIDALGAIGQPSSSAVLRTYVRHRDPALRKAAVKALGGTKGPEAILAFKEGLRANDGVVRGFSAMGLGNLGVKDALPDLFLALDRNVTEAAGAIGQLCAVDDCERFMAKLGAIPLDVMTSGLDPILFRTLPLTDEALLKIVGKIRELGTPEAGKYLADVQSRWPATASTKVKQALDSAVTSIPGARGAGGG